MILEALDDAVAPLVAAGIRATHDPRNLAVPGAMAVLDSFDPAGPCAYDVRVDIFLVAPGPANADALRVLDDLDGRAEQALGQHAGELVGYEHPSTGDLLAAIRIAHTVTVNT